MAAGSALAGAGEGDPEAGDVAAEAAFGAPGVAPGCALADVGEVDLAAGGVAAEAADVSRPVT